MLKEVCENCLLTVESVDPSLGFYQVLILVSRMVSVGGVHYHSNGTQTIYQKRK
jgi:hypothetical protein